MHVNRCWVHFPVGVFVSTSLDQLSVTSVWTCAAVPPAVRVLTALPLPSGVCSTCLASRSRRRRRYRPISRSQTARCPGAAATRSALSPSRSPTTRPVSVSGRSDLPGYAENGNNLGHLWNFYKPVYHPVFMFIGCIINTRSINTTSGHLSAAFLISLATIELWETKRLIN